jgi:hypothetical protein
MLLHTICIYLYEDIPFSSQGRRLVHISYTYIRKTSLQQICTYVSYIRIGDTLVPRFRRIPDKNHIASTEIGERVMLRNHCLSSWQTTGISGIAPEKRFDYAVSRMIATSVLIFAVSDSGSTDGAGSLHVK